MIMTSIDDIKKKYTVEDIKQNKGLTSEMVMGLKLKNHEEAICQIENCKERADWIQAMKDKRGIVILCFQHHTETR